MKEYKSVQDLILKAALRDGVSTTIRPFTGGIDTIEIEFTRGNEHSAVAIDLEFHNEHMALSILRSALFRLFEEPYKNIIPKER